jgi:hypothetical protein
MNSDFRDLLQQFAEDEVRYLVIGGYAVIHHSEPRFTRDLDIWLEPTVGNARKAARALGKFGIPLIEVTEADLAVPGTQLMVGMPPCAIDLLTSCPPMDFADCWDHRASVVDRGLTIHFMGKADLMTAKEATGRPQDLADLAKLRMAWEEE